MRLHKKLAVFSFAVLAGLGGFLSLIKYQRVIAEAVFAGRNQVTAALTGVTLNNGTVSLTAGNDITVQTTALSPDAGAYRWTRDGANYMALNMPFTVGTQSDLSGNTNNGTLAGNAAAATGCKVGGCLSLDGNGDYVTIPDHASLRPTSAYTIEFWMKQNIDSTCDGVRNNFVPVGKVTIGSQGYMFYEECVGNQWAFFQYGLTPNSILMNSPNSPGNWKHFAAVYTGSQVRVFVDGDLANSSAVTGTPTQSTGALEVGRYGGAPYYFDGMIDELRLYPYALSDNQIAQSYTDGLGSNQNATDGVGGPTIIQSEETAAGQLWDLSITPITTSGTVGSALESSNPVVIVSGVPTITGTLDNPDDGSPIISSLTIPGGSTASYRWLKNGVNQTALNMPFNTGGTQSDLSGNANNGTTTNGAEFTTSGCQVGGCMVFDGVNDYVLVNDSASMSFNSSMTITAWIKPTSVAAYQSIFAVWNNTSNQRRFQFYLAPGGGLGATISPDGAAAAGYEGVGSVTTGVWNFVAVNYDTASTNLRYYVNDLKVYDAGTGITGLFDSNRPHYIGMREIDNGVFNIPFVGSIDELQLFPTSLSHAQILQMYQDGLAGGGGPIRISAQDHALGDSFDLLATEITSGGVVGSPNFIDNATIVLAAATTPGITTPSGTQSGNITIDYSCSDTTSLLRDFLVEYSTNSGGSFASATLVSTTSGGVAGSILSMVNCASGTSNNSFVWDSLANGVTVNSTVQIRITAQYPSGPSATTANFTVDNGTDLCTAGLPSNTLTAANLTYENQAVRIVNCTITIDGPHQFTRVTLGDSSGSNDSVLTHSATTTSAVNSLDITTTVSFTVNSDGFINAAGRGFLGSGQGGNASTAGRTTGNTTTGGSSFNSGASYAGLGGQGSTGALSTVYGDFTNPTEPGGGGGGYNDGSNRGGTGGGLVRIVSQGSIVLNGTISANGNGQTAVGGGGAGGGVYLNAATSFSGNGTITANGGTALLGGQSIGGGGGGRIAVHYGSSSFTGSTSVNGGSRDGSADFGGGGTVFFKSAIQDYGDLYISNSLSPSSDSTPYPFHIRRSTSTGLTATVLTDTSANFTTNALAGLSLNPNTNQFTSFTIVSNTATTITVSGDMTVVAAAGNSYAVARTTLDNFTISGTGKAAVDDFTFTVLEDLTLSDTAILTHSGATLSDVPRLSITLGVLTINNGSALNVTGRGFLGSGQGGNASTQGRTTGNVTTGGSDTRAGGSYGGRGGAGSSGTPAAAYGSITDPIEPGSGGGGFNDGVNRGGNGGGLVRITATSVVVNGSLLVNGNAQNAVGGGGAGGGLYINTGSLSGNGTISANGGNGLLGGQNLGGGGGGRIALYYQSNTFAGTLSAIGGAKDGTGIEGGAGTIYTKSNSQTYGDLLIDGGIRLPAEDSTPLPSVPTVFDNVTIQGSAKALSSTLSTVNGTMLITGNGWFSDGGPAVPLTVGVLTINSGGNLTHPETDTSTVHKIDITVTGNMTVGSGSTVNVVGRGFLGGLQGGNVSTAGRTTGNVSSGSTSRFGASHGGNGGTGSSGSLGSSYGSLSDPVEPGAGGGGIDGSNRGGDGGGLVRLTVAGTLSVSGSILAGGGDATAVGGGGAGGAMYLNVGTLSGAGTLSVAGGTSPITFQTIGGGGGGRIALYYDTSTFSGSYVLAGGTGQSGAQYGGSGTIFLKDNAVGNGDLLLNNASQSPAAVTRLFVAGEPSTYTFVDLSIFNLATLTIDSPCSGTPALTVLGSTNLSGGGTLSQVQGACTISTQAISITTTALQSGVIGNAYSQTIASVGGYSPHTFVCRDGGLTVDCATVLPPGLAMSSAGVITGTPTTYGSYDFTVRATEASPGVGTHDQALSIFIGNAPTAPSSLFSHSTDAQTCCSSATTDATPVFSAIFNDPDAGNTGAKYRIQVASDAGFTSLLWDSSSSGIAMASTDIGSRSPNINYAGSALTLGGVTYYWRIKFWDNTDIESPFSATATFTTSTAPTAPTTLFSNDGSAQTGLTNPVGVTSGRPNFSAVFNDPDIGDIANKYRIQVDDNNDFSSVVWDSGAAGTSMTNCNEGARCADIAFGAIAQLEADESVYFWRIKFFDQSGVESPWSQDPISTNKFTMGTGGSSQQRITDLQQQNQEQQEQESLPAAPQTVSVEVLGSTTLRYNWLDNSNNETGFRLLDANDAVIADVPFGTTSAQEINLAPNTQVTGRKVVAYNAVGQSSPSEFGSAVTSAPDVRPRLLGRNQHSVTFSIEPAFSSFPGDTAIMYEILVTRPRLGVSQLRLSSEWIQSNEYTFEGIEADDEIEVRVTTRNQAAISSEPTVYEEMEDLSRRFAVTLGVFKKGTNTLPRLLATNEVLTVSVQLQNVGSLSASNVLVSLPLPRYIVYRSGTLTVDGRIQSDGADQDAGQAGANAISAIWSQIAPNETHILRFELAFDEATLNLLRPQPTTDANLAQAAANPIINLQVAVSFAESEDVYMSPVVSLEPDVTTSEPIVTPEPEPTPEEPVPLPTPEEVQEINEFLNQMIQQEVQESGGDTGATPPSAPKPEPTNVSSDGPSFNVEVTNDAGESLSLTGMATPLANQIQFSGTTSQPFTLVTLIFNNSVTVIVVSDANGQWHTYVSAEQLGIKSGQEASVVIEAVASKGDLHSERVQVGEVKISLGRSGDIEAEFDTTVSSNATLTVINEVRKEVVRVIEEQQPVIQTTLSVTAPVVVVSSVPLWGYLPYVPTMIYHFLTYLLGLIGRKKKGQQRFYGVVYDSITKQPLPLAIVRIYSLVPLVVIPSEAEARLPAPEPIRSPSGEAAANGRSDGGQGSHPSQRKLVSTTVTDKLGRYEALLAPGKYTLEVTKPTYQFPSQIVTTEIDANYHIYKSQDGMTIGEHGTEITVPDVPLDPVNTQRQWQLTGGIKKAWLAIQKVGNYLAVPVLLVGSIASVVTVAAVPDKGVNWLLAIMYVLLLAAQLRLRPKLLKAWGVVYDIATNAVLPLTTIQLIDPQYGKVVTSRLSDYEGRFSFLPEPGSYVLKATRAGYEHVEVVETPSSERQPISNKIVIQKPEQAITGDVAMRAAST